MNNMIGLIIYGTKGGLNVLCNNEVVSSDDQEVYLITNSDLRDYIRVNKTGLSYFMMEHTKSYKVFTQYISCIESQGRSGGFVGIGLYVPHHLKVTNLFTILHELSALYKEKYLDPLAYKMLTINENILDFTPILEKVELLEETTAQTPPLHDRQPTAIAPYSNDEELIGFFESPYRKTFISHERVIFLAEEILNNSDSYLGSWPRTPLFIHKVSPPSEGIPFAKSADFQLIRVTINGTEYSEEAFYAERFSEEDTLSLTLQKRYHQDLRIEETTIKQGTPRYWQQTVDGYRWNNILFSPKRYPIEIIVTGTTQPVNVELWKDGRMITSSINGLLTVQGDLIGERFDLFVEGSHEPCLKEFTLRIDDPITIALQAPLNPQQPQERPKSQETTYEGEQKEEREEHPPKNRTKKGFIGLLLLVIAIIMLLFGYLLLKSHTSKSVIKMPSGQERNDRPANIYDNEKAHNRSDEHDANQNKTIETETNDTDAMPQRQAEVTLRGYAAIGLLSYDQRSLNKVKLFLTDHPDQERFAIGGGMNETEFISRNELEAKINARQKLLDVLLKKGGRRSSENDFRRWYETNKHHFNTHKTDVISMQRKALEKIIAQYTTFANHPTKFKSLLHCGEELGFLQVEKLGRGETSRITKISFKE